MQKWGLPPIQVVSDYMLKHFERRNPVDWDTMALKQLCQIADRKSSSLVFCQLRVMLNDAYCARQNHVNETKELSAKYTGHVLRLMEGEQRVPNSLREKSAEKYRVNITGRAPAPSTSAMPAESIRPSRDDVRAPNQSKNNLQTQSGEEARCTDANTSEYRRQSQNPDNSQTTRQSENLDNPNRRLAEIKYNLIDAIHQQYIPEAKLGVEKSRRDNQILLPYHCNGERKIKVAEEAVSTAVLRVEEARKDITGLRWDVLKQKEV
jgi:hypothetical protein